MEILVDIVTNLDVIVFNILFRHSDQVTKIDSVVYFTVFNERYINFTVFNERYIRKRMGIYHL